jgi:hypothetical protein
MVACRPMSGVKKILCYEVLSSTEWGEGFKPNYYVELTQEFFIIKTEAIRKYTAELRASPHPRSLVSIMNLMIQRGFNICVDYAEAFELVREVE